MLHGYAQDLGGGLMNQWWTAAKLWKKLKLEACLSMVVCLAQCACTEVKAFHTNHSTLHDFCKYGKACFASEDRLPCNLFSSYHQGTFEQVIQLYR